LVAGAVIAGLTLAACGGDPDGGSGSGDGGSAAEVEVFTWWAAGSEKAGLDAMVGVFNSQHPDITFVNGAVAGGAGSAAKDLLQSRLQASDPPDTFQAHAGLELMDYINAAQLEDVSGLYDEFDLHLAFPADLVDRLTHNGNIYSIPSNIHRANVVWANPAVLEDNGIDPGTSYADLDEWFADLDTLQDAGVTPLSVATAWTQVHLLETILLASLGPDDYSGLWDGSTDWTGADVSAALENFERAMGYTNGDRDGLDWPEATQMVIDGNAAFNIMGDWAVAAFEEQNKVLGTDFTAFPVPGTDGVFDFLADSFTLPVGAKNEEGTKAWLDTVASAEGQKAFNLAKGSIPARTDADPEDYPAYQKTALESWKNDTIAPSLAHGAAASVKWLTDVTAAVSQFSANKDVAKLKSGLADAAEKNQGCGCAPGYHGGGRRSC
jgi:glucose/mannose transport system substrate-binding protein